MTIVMQNWIAILLITAPVLCYQQAVDLNAPVVEIPKLGKLKGFHVNLDDDEDKIYAGQADVFLGIPFAKPPVEDLRLRKPKPVEKFSETGEVYNAVQFGDICPQIQYKPLNLTMSEDCLYLNVFTPNSNEKAKYPVMVWIHGGGFSFGSASEWGINGTVSNLVSRGVVVVSIQYRLGALGFFTANTTLFTPNLGMLDQVEALKFVKQHIEHFGGDPDSITLFGESAGGCSVSAHALSPLSQNLFHQGIMQSGALPLCLDGLLGKSDRSEVVAKEICNVTLPTTETEELERLRMCLKKANISDFLELEKDNENGWRFSPDNRFFPEPLDELMKKRPDIPMIIGTNHDEWVSYELYKIDHGLPIETFTRDYVKAVLTAFASQAFEDAEKLVDLLLTVYTPPYLQDDDHVGWLRVQSDVLTGIIFTSPAANEAIQRLNGKSKVYLYEFNFVNTGTRIYSETPGWRQAYHTMELPFLFMQEYLWNPMNRTNEDFLVAEFMGKSWTDFAKHGIPCEANGTCMWKPTEFDGNSLRYLSINDGNSLRYLTSNQMMPDYRPVDRAIFGGVLPALYKLLAQLKEQIAQQVLQAAQMAQMKPTAA